MKSTQTGNTVYLLNKPGVNDSYFYDLQDCRNDMGRPYIYLREEIERAGFVFKITHDCADLNDVAAILSFCYIDQKIADQISKYPKQQCFLMITEPPSLLPYLYHPNVKHFFGTIFTMLDDYVDGQTYIKFHHPHTRDIVKLPASLPDFDQRKLCAMILSNYPPSRHPKDLYSERRKLAEFYKDNEDFDLYGGGWDGYHRWKGAFTGDRLTIFQNYRFNFAYDNTRDLPGYMSDRLIDTIYGGGVPIYWGASNITDYVPKECFIDRRDFASNEEVYQFIKSMDCKTFETYVDAGRKYLLSPQAHLFSPTHFAKTIVDRIVQAIR
jgi:alpha(1,3/1,4) fucosyltransferase